MNLQQIKTKAEGALSTISTGADSIAGLVEMLLNDCAQKSAMIESMKKEIEEKNNRIQELEGKAD